MAGGRAGQSNSGSGRKKAMIQAPVRLGRLRLPIITQEPFLANLAKDS
jgi:hypothetical protein